MALPLTPHRVMPEPPYVTAAAHITSEDSARLEAIARVKGISLGELCDRALSDALSAISGAGSADVALDRRRENESNRLYAVANACEDKDQAREIRRYAAMVRSGAAPLPSAQGRKGASRRNQIVQQDDPEGGGR